VDFLKYEFVYQNRGRDATLLQFVMRVNGVMEWFFKELPFATFDSAETAKQFVLVEHSRSLVLARR